MKKPTDSPQPDKTGPYYPHPPKNRRGAGDIGNTGLQTSKLALFQEETGCHVLVDYLAFTLHPSDILATVDCIKDYLGSGWFPALGRYGYTHSLFCDDVRIFYGDVLRLGIHVEATGKGCYNLSTRISSWESLLKSLLALGAKFTRIDVAADDITGLVSISQIIKEYEQGLVSTRSKTGQPVEIREVVSKRLTSHGIRFGNPASDTFIRIYDKALERDVPGPWVRVELQKRGNQAQLLAKAIVEHGLAVIPGWIRSSLDFKEENRNGGRSRRPTVWWRTFLHHASRFKHLKPAKDEKDNTRRKWLIRQVAPSLAAYHDEHEKDGPGRGFEEIKELIKCGQERNEANREKARLKAKK